MERVWSLTNNYTTNLPRPEYPRPDFVRTADSWLNLNGKWEFEFDDEKSGQDANWQNRRHFEQEINVPFAFQSKLSGIGDPNLHDHLWYAREFELPENWAGSGKRFLLNFGAVDYFCQIWVNGRKIGEHQGGHVPFYFDISDVVKTGEPNRVVVYVEDTQSKFQPRGKQYWKLTSEHCFYTRTSGIWQTVWLEAVPEIYLSRLQVQTDIDKGELDLAIEAHGSLPQGEIYWLKAEISFEGASVWEGVFGLFHEEIASITPRFMGRVVLPDAKLWSPENPNLYDLSLTLCKGTEAVDRVESYFGMRKISSENGKIFLNNQPYYLRLILDQGYFPEGLLTAPSDADLKHDIEMTKAFGFNGARKHQKIEDPRWLYWADKLGLLVWGEMPSAYEWSPEAERPFISEWLQTIVRDYNHPCVMTWVPFNESWGIGQIAQESGQQTFVKKVVALTRDLDKTRLVVDNDGWEHLGEEHSDLLTIHDYTAEGKHLVERYAQFGRDGHEALLPLVSERPILLPSSRYRGEPIIFSEFGGISLIPANKFGESQQQGDWGYSNADDSQRLIDQYRGLIEALNHLGFSAGFCYTQLTDVEQEVNGLLTYDRRPKVDPAIIADINLILSNLFERKQIA